MSTLLYLILNTFNRLRQWSQENRVFMQNLALLGRSLLFLAGILAVVWAGTWIFIIGGLEAGIILPTFSQLNLRYAILPILSVICILFASAAFIQDVYNLKNFMPALRFVLSTMFGMFTPRLTIEQGRKQVSRGRTNLIDVIGGPGSVLVQPGNAVLFSMVDRTSRTLLNQDVMLEPFEVPDAIVSLEDQHGTIDELLTITRDGIQVRLRNINFRYRIQTREDIAPNLDDPYPHDVGAMSRMVANLPVSEQGLVPWQENVRSLVGSAIRQYINARTIDYLTAPSREGKGGTDPRAELRSEILKPENNLLSGLGTTLLWVDAGHIDIIMEDVDKERLNLWAADSAGSAGVKRALGEAKYQAYMELGRAEAQAELIVSISAALEDIDFSDAEAEQNIRNLFLLRTSQVLEAMRDKGQGGQEPQ